MTRRDALSFLFATVPAALLAGCGGSGSSPRATIERRYIALGDSYAYGYSTRAGTPTGFGDIGYVRLFADALKADNGGARPEVLNLAIPGETTATYLRAGSGTPALPYNRNYTATNAPSQSALLVQKTAENSIPIGWVTAQVGGDDLLNLLIDPVFLGASPVQRQSIIAVTLDTLRSNLRTILTQVRNTAPQARVLVLGYPDPFAGLGAENPLAGISTPLAEQVNSLISQAANEASARYVDLFTPFLGQETMLTLITTQDPPDSGVPNFHPSPAGYGRIAELLVAASRS
ncbi:MAG: GDSL-type esterase/lipase family protein [Armatimonadota bacterium]